MAEADRFIAATWTEVASGFGVPSWVLLAFGVVAGVAYLIGIAEFSGAPLRLTSEFVAQHIAEAFRGSAYILLIHCGGEMVDRDSATGVVSKVAALGVVVLVALTAFGAAAVATQVAWGQPPLDPVLCAYAVYIDFGWHVFLLAAAAIAIQVALRHVASTGAFAGAPAIRDVFRSRWFGMLVAAAFFLAVWALGDAPFGPAPVRYSGMNGYGHYFGRFYASGLCWTAFTVLLVLSIHVWTRSGGLVRKPWRPPEEIVNIGAPAVVVWAATAFWICVNTGEPISTAAFPSPFPSPSEPHVRARVPYVVAMDLTVDLYPEARRVESGGSMLLANIRSEPIRELRLFFPREVQVESVDIASIVEPVGEPGVHRYVFARPLRFGERVRMDFSLAWNDHESGKDRNPPRLVENGAFIGSADILPSFGREPTLASQGLGSTRIRMVIGTSLDQVAVGPGLLLREWKENARRYFEYERDFTAQFDPRSKASGSVSPDFSIHSGRYAVARRRWNDTTVEVYHHPEHGGNVGSMFRCVRQSLGPAARSSWPYRGGLLRIVEIPYQGEAHVFPHTVLFSERREFAFDVGRGAGLDALCASVARGVAQASRR